ncbi:MAG: hypothetical protein JWM59_3753 [Verrucomicrobiales bacterium]|nr:hypothetical protein [Verrucomicrobiales bacterium]
MTHSDSSLCPVCGTVRTDEAPDGLCPACLMREAMQPTGGGGPIGSGPEVGTDTAVPPLSAVAAAFPQWEVLELIGRGGMGAVFRIRQPKLNRLAALKIIPASLAERDPAFAGRFEREGELLARLHHPNIVNVHDSGRSGDFYYLLMEHVDGVNLRQAMRANRFTPQQALSVVPKICEALQYAHEEGVLHRDIKPENILLDSKGRVKLADFGIAKLMEPAAVAESAGEVLNAEAGWHSGSGEPARDPDSLTKTGSALGTPCYMAPEQAECPQGVDHRADIYSLGVVFYELLTGQLPASGAFSPPSAWAAVDHRVDGIVRQALERERERRQRSAGEMKTQVETLAGGFSAEEIAAAVAGLRRNFDYKSKRTVMGMPLLHVAYGYDPVTRKPMEARGFFAFGGVACGVFAFGGRARGFFAFGGLATGVVAFGGVAVGLVSMGGLALAAGLALGGMAVGTFATGGMAVGWFCEGGMALGWNAAGGMVYAHLGTGGRVIATHVVRAGEALPAGLRWVMGLSPVVAFTGVFMVVPMLAAALVPVWARRQVEAGRGAGNQGGGMPQDGRSGLGGRSGRLENRKDRSLAALAFTLMLHTVLLAVFCYALAVMLARSALLIANFGIMPSKLAGAAVREASSPGGWYFLTLLILDAGICLLAHILAGRRGLRRWTMAAAAGMVAVLVLTLHEVATPIQRMADQWTPPVPAAASAADSTSHADVESARRIYEILKARHEAGMTNALELLDAVHDLDVAEARAGNSPAGATAATLKWAKARMELIMAWHEAGLATKLEVLDARRALAVAEAEAAQNPAAAAAADLDWARARLEFLTSQYGVGNINFVEVERAKADLRRAEAKITPAAPSGKPQVPANSVSPSAGTPADPVPETQGSPKPVNMNW